MDIRVIKVNGVIKTFDNIPKFWNNIPYYNTLGEIRFTADGWQTVTVPTIDLNTQKLSDIYEDGNGDYTYDVIELTLQEIEDGWELDDITEFDTHIQKGIEASLKLKSYLKRQLNTTQYKNARVLVRPVWYSLRLGDWDIALDEITVIDDANSTAISQTIKTRIQAYVTNNF